MKITILALDRIKDIRNSAEEFIQNNLFQPENHFNYLIGVSVPERPEPEKIIIKVSKVQAPYLLTKPIHYTQEVLQQINTGELLISIYLACNFELKAALLSYGPEIEILEPMSLRMDLKKLFDVGANLYAKQPSELVKYGS